MNIDTLQIMLPELGLTLIIFIVLFLKVTEAVKSPATLLNIIISLLVINCVLPFFGKADAMLFNGMFHTSQALFFEKALLNLGTLIISLFSFEWLKRHAHMPEFFVLMLSTLLGMHFMISSGNFLMFYLGLELSGIPLAAMANYNLHERRSSEAAVKMILSSAFASAMLLFGISMLYGTTGTLDFNELAPLLRSASHLQVLAFLFVFAGFAFKLSAVPFHFWTADVYEGAPVGVTAYLSVISKASVVFIFITILFKLFANFSGLYAHVLTLSILLTIAVGNLFALRQQNMKRFLAFSSIAQMGYILLGISSGTNIGAASAIFFLLVYTFSNLGIFGVVGMVSLRSGKERIDDYKGFYQHNKFASWVLAICLFSLAGIPPTAGFFGKMFLVTAGASKGNFPLITFAALNMVVSLYYYLRVIKAVFIDDNPHPLQHLKSGYPARLALIICMAGVIVTGFVSGLFDHIILLTGK